jgi:hypothetical protein
VNNEYFQLRDLVLKWDAPKKDKGKHGKFEALWIGPFKISKVLKLGGFQSFWWPYKWALSKTIFRLSRDWLSTIVITTSFVFFFE